MRHKHADLIHAWAEGAEIQYNVGDGCGWHDYEAASTAPSWDECCQYRIKPEPKPDVVCYFTAAKHDRQPQTQRLCGDNLKLTFDGETGKLIKAEVL